MPTGTAVVGTSNGDIVRVRQARRLHGRVRLPGDKSVTHRALILAALAPGGSRIADGSDGLDPNSTAACLEALGVIVERERTQDGRIDRVVRSPGAESLRQPADVLDCGNSGTTLRLLAGALAGVPLRAVLDGDASLRRRPVARIIEPLRSMGAVLDAREGDSVPPLTVHGRRPLRAIDYTTAVPSAQVKSAILLAALSAEGTTTVRETVATRDHTERMLGARGVTVRRGVGDGAQSWVSIDGPCAVTPLDERVPGDISAAAFWLVAGATNPDAELRIEGAGVNPTRRAVIDLLRDMGAQIDETPARPVSEVSGPSEGGSDGSEPAADLTVRSSRLSGIDITATDTARAIDEIPALMIAAACAGGTTVIRGVAELRRKESDRVAAMATGLRAMGVRVDVDGDDLSIRGLGDGRRLRGADVASDGDHRIAMAFAVAGLVATGETAIDGASSAAVSDPTFFETLAEVRG